MPLKVLFVGILPEFQMNQMNLFMVFICFKNPARTYNDIDVECLRLID